MNIKRPRSWSPNCLNWASWIHGNLGDGVTRIIKQRVEEGTLPEEFHSYVDLPGDAYPTIRSVVEVPDGDCVVEADYQTAEMRGLAYIAGDSSLITIIEGTDDCFVLVKPESCPEGMIPEDCPCRVRFPDTIRLPDNKEEYLYTYTSKGKIVAKFTEDDFQRDVDGNFISPRFDIHWKTVEDAQSTAREVLDKKRDRGAGKVGNFSSAYGASPVSIERKIRADTGTKPPEGTGEAILAAIEGRQPRATEYLKGRELVPVEFGYIRAASGRIRHCHTLADNITGLDSRTRNGQITKLGRECRNFELQESVGATAARACINLLDFHMKHRDKLKGYPMVCLYDSVVIHCPENERAIWMKAINLYMFLANGWEYHGRLLRYPIDIELNGGWSTKPSKEKKHLWEDESYEPTPENLKGLEKLLDLKTQIYHNKPMLSVTQRVYNDRH